MTQICIPELESSKIVSDISKNMEERMFMKRHEQYGEKRTMTMEFRKYIDSAKWNMRTQGNRLVSWFMQEYAKNWSRTWFATESSEHQCIKGELIRVLWGSQVPHGVV